MMRAEIPLPEKALIVRELVARDGMRGFVRAFWSTADVAPYKSNWHIDAMCAHADAVQTREIRNLLVNVWPGGSKSSVFSALFPAKVWATEPTHKFLAASQDAQLVNRDSDRMCKVVRSELYRLAFPDGATLPDVTNVTKFDTYQGGMRYNTTVKGGGIGWHANTHIYDDVLKPMDLGKENNKTVLTWLSETMVGRRAEPLDWFARMLIMQRLGEGDPSDWCLENGWEHLCLPFRYEPNAFWDMGSSIGGAKRFDPRTEPGTFGDLVRHTPATAAKMVTDYKLVADAQLDQNVHTNASKLLLPEWFGTYDQLPHPSFLQRCQFWDFNTKGKESAKHSRVSGLNVGLFRNHLYYLDHDGGWWDWVTSREKFWEAQERDQWCNGRIWIEDKANGTPLISELANSQIKHMVTALEPTKGFSKTERFELQTPKVQRGLFLLPRVISPKCKEWLDEVCRFPAPPNDHGDTLEMALRTLVNLDKPINDTLAVENLKTIGQRSFLTNGFRRY